MKHFRHHFILYNILLQRPTFAHLEAAIILPHGDFAYDPTLLPLSTPQRHAADQISHGALKIATWFDRSIHPEIIFLSTPHGIELSRDFGLYLGSNASGIAHIGEDLHDHGNKSYDVRLDGIHLDPKDARDILKHVGKDVSGVLVSADDSEDMPLHWAEVIPLLLINGTAVRAADLEMEEFSRQRRLRFQQQQQQQQQQQRRRPPKRKHLILSHPLRRYTEAPLKIIPELLHLGHSLRQWIDHSPHRIGIVISGDLSHTHQPNGPYGYSNTSFLFDDAVGRWADGAICDEEHSKALLVEASALQDEALSCGFTGFVLLHGMLCGDDGDDGWVGNVEVNLNATYYGMMAARFVRSDD